MTFDEAIKRLDELSSDTLTKEEYKILSRLLHPDIHPDRVDEATEAFAYLTSIFEGNIKSPRDRFTINTKRQSYLARQPATFIGMNCNYYQRIEHREDNDDAISYLKIARTPEANARLEIEAQTLQHLHKEVGESVKAFLPKLRSSFRYRDAAKVTRRVNELEFISSDLHSLHSVFSAYAPYPLDPRDAAWMFRRLLYILGHIHKAGRTHGAVSLDHVLIDPNEHGLILCGWGSSSDSSKDTTKKEALDVKNASQTFSKLVGANNALLPKSMRAFVRGSIGYPPAAHQLLGEFDDLLSRLYGKRVFRHFSIPKVKGDT